MRMSWRRVCLSQVGVLMGFLFGFMRKPTAKTPEPILTQNTPKDAVVHKDVLDYYCDLQNLAEKYWSRAQGVNDRDQDVDSCHRDETLVRLDTVSRPRP